jgi:hypothetical protein
VIRTEALARVTLSTSVIVIAASMGLGGSFSVYATAPTELVIVGASLTLVTVTAMAWVEVRPALSSTWTVTS